MAYESARGVTVLFGGGAEARNGETREWDGTVWDPRTTVGPQPRNRAALAYDQARGEMVLFGGSGSGGALADTWLYRGCSGREKIKNARCQQQQGSNRLRITLTGGIVGDTVTVTLTDGSTQSGTLDDRGKGKAKFIDRVAGEVGAATTAWGCGASDTLDYACP